MFTHYEHSIMCKEAASKQNPPCFVNGQNIPFPWRRPLHGPHPAALILLIFHEIISPGGIFHHLCIFPVIWQEARRFEVDQRYDLYLTTAVIVLLLFIDENVTWVNVSVREHGLLRMWEQISHALAVLI